METTSDHFEIVHVTKPCALLDADLREQVYWRRNGIQLAVGYYVVSWPVGTKKRIYNDEALFRGPFRSHDLALEAVRHLERSRIATHRTPTRQASQKALA